MLAIGVALALLSAVTQASAHSLLRAGRDKLIIRAAIGLTSGLLAVPVCVFVAPPSQALLPWLLLSNAVHAIYQLVLIRAYEGTDFSVAYPVARGVAPVGAAVFGLILLGDQISAVSFLGVIIVPAGLGLIAYSGRFSRAGFAWAMLAGLLTTTYTLIDAKAVRLAADPLTFVAWFFVLDGVIMGSLALAARRRRFFALLWEERAKGIAAGVFSLVTYGAALLALRWLAAGVTAALRETSVLFSLLIAVVLLKERLSALRRIGAVLVTVGAVLIAIGLHS